MPAAVAVAQADAALRSAEPADTPVATDAVSADADSATQEGEAAMLSGLVTVELAAETDQTAAAVHSHEGHVSEIWGQHPDKTISPSCMSPTIVDIRLSPSCASPNTADIKLITGEDRAVVDDADASSAGPLQAAAPEDANARMAAELAAILHGSAMSCRGPLLSPQ